MKVNYLATVATISLLSVGVAVGCSNPCAAKTTTPQSNTEVQANPCASKTNPCASKTNPCAAKKQ